MTAGLLDQLVSLVTPPAIKAVTGPGFRTSSIYPQVSSFHRDPPRLARQAQDVYIGNRHVRKAERVIAQRFSTVPWHLEDGEGNRIGTGEGENAAPAYLAILDLLERPYRPQVDEPQYSVPRTRATLWALTGRHMGICGYGFWYLDEVDGLAGTPRSLLYINPARMQAATDKQGALIGWVLDPDDRGGGTPLEVAQVLPFQLEPPDTGYYGVGLVETAMSMVDLTTVGDRHAQGVLRAGGRLAGTFSPKEGEMSQEVYDQLVLDLRSAADAPDSARRTNILRGPVEFHQMSATPSELDLVGVMAMTGDQISELWGVPRSQMGAAAPAGLNSGDSKGYDEAVLWQNAVGPRLRSFVETVQYELLDRWKVLGLDPQLVIEEPEFDDETPLFERASKAVTQPLTNKERRELLGLDPFDDERDEEVWLANTMSRVYPEAETPPQLAPFTGQAPEPPVETEEPPDEFAAVKAALGDVRARGVAAMEADVSRLLRRYGDLVAERVREKHAHLVRKPTDVDAVFSQARMERDLAAVMEPHLAAIARGTRTSVGGKAVDPFDTVIDALIRNAGRRIVGIAETTRKDVSDIIRRGIDDGLGAAELGDLIEKASNTFGEERAERIARTETATILNESAVAQYREFGVEKVQVVDGDGDEPCAAADGSIWTLEEAEANPIAHPNCVRSFTPLVGAPAKAVDPLEVLQEMVRGLMERLANQPPPIVNVTTPTQPAPIVNLPAPIVTMAAPVVNVPAADVVVKQEPDPLRMARVIRGPDGRIVGLVEERT